MAQQIEITRKTKTPRITAIEKAITFTPQKSKEIEEKSGVNAVYNHLQDEVRVGRLVKTNGKYSWPANAIVDGKTYEDEMKEKGLVIEEPKQEEPKQEEKKVSFGTLSDKELYDLAKKEFPELPENTSRKDIITLLKMVIENE